MFRIGKKEVLILVIGVLSVVRNDKFPEVEKYIVELLKWYRFKLGNLSASSNRPVSYTHLDVYKRQTHYNTLMLM